MREYIFINPFLIYLLLWNGIYMFVILKMFYVFMLIFWIEIVPYFFVHFQLCVCVCGSVQFFVCLFEIEYICEWFWEWLFSFLFQHKIVYCVFAYLELYFVFLFNSNSICMWMVVWMFIYEYVYVIWNCIHVFVVLNYEFECICIM